MLSEPTSYLQHYLSLQGSFENVEQIYRNASEEVKAKIMAFADNGRYKYEIYRDINPSLQRSPFIDNLHGLSGDIIRFRLGSHVCRLKQGVGLEQKDRIVFAALALC